MSFLLLWLCRVFVDGVETALIALTFVALEVFLEGHSRLG